MTWISMSVLGARLQAPDDPELRRQIQARINGRMNLGIGVRQADFSSLPFQVCTSRLKEAERYGRRPCPGFNILTTTRIVPLMSCHSDAVLRASSSSTTTRPGKVLNFTHCCSPAISPARRKVDVLRRSAKAEPPRSSGPCPFGWPAVAACRWSSSARAGVRRLSAAKMSRVAWNAPRVAVPMRLTAAWYSPSIPLPPSRESSAAYNRVP